ncbi:AAA family ATPase [Arthrobacter sp. H14]|uniref:AAA family ATPase n=1 Tax=Arthrobacter sp. H14 TaxID=1312959 RepID=UPI00047A35B6|nr:SMC family ATPase [Arthrobacter sp. H14]
MRISRLEIQAFGPFANREVIDFDELSSQGLFLLNGPTGAGKTSVLDAICFALYGTVPGARQDGKRLRSDHADPATVPEVVCRFSASGRTFEVTRNPAWQRPSSRAAKGTTPEQAKTLLRELINGEWLQKSSRNDEAGQEITELLGMNAKQFTRVVMLPQGEFAAFLRSDANDRQELLQQLFGTERFKSVEQQLLADAAVAKEQLSRAESGVELILHKASDEAAKYPAPEADEVDGGEPEGNGPNETTTSVVDSPDGTLEEDDGTAGELDDRARLAGWVQQITGLAQAAADQSVQARSRAAAARTEHQELSGRLARFDKLTAAQRAGEDLAGQTQLHADRIGKRRLHRAAELLQSRLSSAEEAVSAHTKCAELSADRRRPLLEHPFCAGILTSPGEENGQTLSVELLSESERGLNGQLAVLEALVPEERDLQEKQGQLVRLESEETAVLDKAERMRHRSAELDSEIAAAKLRLDESSALAGTVEQAKAEEQRARSVVAAIRSCTVKREQEQQLSAEYRRLQDGYLGAKSRWLELLQKRLEHAAGELAASLEDDTACPVCGSTEHPEPSELRAAARNAGEEEEDARQKQEAAELRVKEAGTRWRSVQQEVAVLESQGGGSDLADAESKAGQATASAEAATKAAQQQATAKEKLSALEEEARTVTESGQEVAAAAAELRMGMKSIKAAVQALEEKLTLARGNHASLQERVEDLRGLGQQMAACLQALRAEENAVAHMEKLAAELADAIAGSAFQSADEVRTALLPADDAAGLEAAIEAHESEQHRVRVLFEDAEVGRAIEEEAAAEAIPDESQVREKLEIVHTCTESAEEASVAQRMLEASLQQLKALQSQLEEALATVEPVREHSELLSGLADLARGSGENGYKMTLNAYVLAARLEQVALCATERLATMTSGRYSLVYDDSRAARGAKSGLGLQVVDEWTGRQRDTSTLSGGESFMASLALALGLADVVQHESGGVDIETLFVDEGFGSLDEDALEQVMDALEGLRDGGRVVGLVSHVPEMKLRIPAQLQVLKSRTGSTLRMREPALAEA